MAASSGGGGLKSGYSDMVVTQGTSHSQGDLSGLPDLEDEGEVVPKGSTDFKG